MILIVLICTGFSALSKVSMAKSKINPNIHLLQDRSVSASLHDDQSSYVTPFQNFLNSIALNDEDS